MSGSCCQIQRYEAWPAFQEQKFCRPKTEIYLNFSQPWSAVCAIGPIRLLALMNQWSLTNQIVCFAHTLKISADTSLVGPCLLSFYLVAATSSGFITPSRKPFSSLGRWGKKGGHWRQEEFKFLGRIERRRLGNFATAAKSIIALQWTSAERSGEKLALWVAHFDTHSSFYQGHVFALE